MALVCYSDDYGSFPPLYTVNAAGQPLHSWRVLLLPYLAEEGLYVQINLNEAWDGPHNRPLAKFMPPCYRCPNKSNADQTATDYLAIVGMCPAWGRRTHMVSPKLEDMDRMMVVEFGDSTTCWMEPRDLTVDEVLNALRPETGSIVGSAHQNVKYYLTVSGDVRALDREIDRAALGALLGADERRVGPGRGKWGRGR